MTLSYQQTLERLQTTILTASPQHILSLLQPRHNLQHCLNIYIEGYRHRLAQAVLSDYPVLAIYLGNTKIHELIWSYIESTLSYSYTLDIYPLGFAEYLTRHYEDGFAHSLALLERAIAEVFLLPESPHFISPLTLAPEILTFMQLKPRIASRLLRLEYSVNHYLSEIRTGNREIHPDLTKQSCYLFIVRHENEVKRHELEYEEYILLTKLCKGSAIGEAIDLLIKEYPHLLSVIAKHLQRWFSRWIKNGFFQDQYV